jgi:hypothetical protein
MSFSCSWTHGIRVELSEILPAQSNVDCDRERETKNINNVGGVENVDFFVL